jgi:hypothetical protein
MVSIRTAMKLVALILLFASTAAFAAGQDGNPDAVVQETNVRKEILSAYKFDPQPGVQSRPAPFLAHDASRTESPDLVNAAPSSLADSKAMNHLHEAVLREQADARAAMVASRLGIGVSSVHLGRYLVAGAATAFYIPVAIGVGVTW